MRKVFIAAIFLLGISQFASAQTQLSQQWKNTGKHPKKEVNSGKKNNQTDKKFIHAIGARKYYGNRSYGSRWQRTNNSRYERVGAANKGWYGTGSRCGKSRRVNSGWYGTGSRYHKTGGANSGWHKTGSRFEKRTSNRWTQTSPYYGNRNLNNIQNKTFDANILKNNRNNINDGLPPPKTDN